MLDIWPERLLGFKLRFSEEDIRKKDGVPGLNLDTKGEHWVPDICQHFRKGYHCPLSLERKKILYHNFALNKNYMGGGLKQKLGSPKKAIILGGGQQKYKFKGALKGTTTIAIDKALKTAPKDTNFFICNNPYPEVLSLPKGESKPMGIFSLGTNPEFIRNFKGLKFFYSSGWEPTIGDPTLVDLVDPISVALSLLAQSECQKILLVNFSLSYKEPRPGTTKLGDLYLYPQQLQSLSLVSALIFWLRRSGKDVYILDELVRSELPEELLENFKEENDAW